VKNQPGAGHLVFLVVFGQALGVFSAGCSPPEGNKPIAKKNSEPGKPTPGEIFERRIRPIFKSPNPSSCTQCHLAGVDLKNYILPSPKKTFLSLRDQGLIDLDKPLNSKILRLIRMGEKDTKENALIHEKVRQREYEAFAAWIKASCADAALRAAPRLRPAERAGPPRPPEVIRHARRDRVLASFEKNVWAQRFRCLFCHSPGGGDNAKLVARHGPRVTWMKKEGAQATMKYLVGSKLIDTRRPDRSLLLRKSLMDGVKHGGGKKMLPGDLGYKAFRSWLEDYAATVRDQYTRAADLPKQVVGPRQFGSEIWFKLEKTPSPWGDRLLQVTVFAWDSQKRAWETNPMAISDRQVAGQLRLWQHNLILLADKDSKRAALWERNKPSLPRGRYLIKVHVDIRNRLRRDWKAKFGKDEFVGQIEMVTNWPEGYWKMTVLNPQRLRR
jgi:hypothetical protein